MQLTIIGSGTCVPSLKRSSPANYLAIGKEKMLIDCGSGTLRQLEKAKLSYKEIDIVLITHFHTDHISDLRALIQALSWTPGFDRKKDLVLVGPVGFKKFYDSYIRPVSGKPRSYTYKIKIKEIRRKLIFKNFIVECVKTVHTNTSIAYRFKEGGKVLVISGDCDYNDSLPAFSNNCDVLLLECSFPDSMKVKGHLTPQECGLIAQKADAKRLILTHIYPTSSEKVRLSQVRKIFLNAILAEDLMKIKI